MILFQFVRLKFLNVYISLIQISILIQSIDSDQFAFDENLISSSISKLTVKLIITFSDRTI